MNIAFIGFGGAAYGIAKGLKQEGIGTISCYTRSWNTPPNNLLIAKRAKETGTVVKTNLQELADAADCIMCCVTGSAASSVASEVAPFLQKRHLYVDLNTAEPEIKKNIAKIIEPTGAAFVDAAMMGGIPTYLHKVPILASGEGAQIFKQTCEPFGMQIQVIGSEPGQAASIKMLRSIFMKGLLALLLEVMETSKKFNATDTVLSSIAETMDKNQFLETARRIVTKGVVNPERMAREMEGVIKTIENLSVSATMSSATREKLLWCSQFAMRDRFGGDIPNTLAEVLDEF